ncbi:MAG: carboxypeptidase regulatory-like domain-containing protein [Gemmatimonadaceae bacterium]
MRTRIALSSLLLAVAASETNAQAVVTGFVRDSAGRSLADVEVVLDGSKARTRTDSLGRYSLTAPIGAYTLSFRMSGFSDRRESVTLTVPDTLLLDARLARVEIARAQAPRAPTVAARVPPTAAPAAADSSRTAPATQQSAQSELARTSWRLLKIRTMADSTFTPADSALYTIAFGSDGKASMRVDCNSGSATWTSEAPGRLAFGPMALTRAMCPEGSLHDRFGRDMPSVRTYVLRDGRLHLATMADGAIYEFEPLR